MNVKDTITIIGAGLMGTAISTLAAAHGYRVKLHDQNEAMLESFPMRAAPIAAYLAGEAKKADDILGAVERSTSLAASLEGSFLVQEAIHENLSAKQELFRQLDEVCAPDIILATNTSSFLLSDIFPKGSGRERMVGVHYVAPAHLIRVVEIITTKETGGSAIQVAVDFLHSIDHVGIVCREQPGFLINRIQYALKAEVQRMVDEGVASVEDIDTAVRLSIGPRLALWGPMLQEDLSTSKATVLAVSEYLHQATGQEHFAPTATLRHLVQSGQTGAPAGAGWYRWSADANQIVQERDRQLGDLLAWLRERERLQTLGATGKNDQIGPNRD